MADQLNRDQVEFIDWLRRSLEKAGLCDSDVARCLGINRSQISRLMKYERDISIREIRPLEDLVGQKWPGIKRKV